MLCVCSVTDAVKCSKTNKVPHEVQPCVLLMLLPHFDVSYDLLQTLGNMEIYFT